MSRSGRPGRRSRRLTELHFITGESREKQPPATLLLAPCVALLYHLGTFMLDPNHFLTIMHSSSDCHLLVERRFLHFWFETNPLFQAATIFLLQLSPAAESPVEAGAWYTILIWTPAWFTVRPRHSYHHHISISDSPQPRWRHVIDLPSPRHCLQIKDDYCHRQTFSGNQPGFFRPRPELIRSD